MSSEETIPLPLDETLGLYLVRLGKTSNTEVRIFDRGEFYSLHNENAIFVATDFLKSPEAIKYLGKDKIPGVAISKLIFEALLRELLIVKQYRVELHAKNDSGWKKVAKGSPGNLSQFEDTLFRDHDLSQSSGVLCLNVSFVAGTYSIAMVYIDIILKQLLFCDITDTEQFCSLESVLVQICPKEVLIAMNPANPEFKKLSQIFQRLNLFVLMQKASSYQSDDGRKQLVRLIRKEDGLSSKLSACDSKMGCLACLFKYLDLSCDESNMNQFEIIEVSPSSYMRLDAAAFSGLNVMPALHNEPEFASLWGILNHCNTPQGQRLLNNWLKQPLLDHKKIVERQDIVEALVEDSQLRQNLSIALKRIPDFFRIAKKVQRGKGVLQDCYKLYMAIKQIPIILDILCNYEGKFQATFNHLFICCLREFEDDFTSYLELVEATVDLDKCDTGEYVIKHTFDEDLGELRNQLDSIGEKIDSEFSQIAKVLKAEKGKAIKLDLSSTYGHCCRVTRKEEKGLRQNKSLEVLQTKKDGVIFTSSILKSLSIEFRSTQKNYEEVQSSIVNEVLKVAAGYSDPMINLNHTLALLDCVSSFANAAVNAPIPFVRPKILPKGSGIIKLTGSRHPCVEGNEEVVFISNDVHLEKGESSFLIITGPNMGGKSTYIRQIGVTSILAQIGCFVPCESAELSIVSSIYARVGATDSQAKGVSTFMAEMLDTSAILSCADSDSLIIIDELGRGTSTYDGFGLAWSISNYIIEKLQCLAVFATHFHEMTNLEDVQKAAKNYHVSAVVEDDSLALLYKVEPGPCDQSFGVHVAKLAHFPQSVINIAQEKSSELDQFKFVPEACLDSGEHSDFIHATQLIDQLLSQLNEKYQQGSRGSELTSVVDQFLSSNHEDIQANPILTHFVNKTITAPVEGS